MRIALVAPPFIPVPPVRYGGTELFVAQLAAGLVDAGHHVTVYANGESRVKGELRWLYPRADWPIRDPEEAALKDVNHTAWACEHASRHADVIHLNCGPGVVFSRFVPLPFVTTLHHPLEPALSRLYEQHPAVHYVAISRAQAAQEHLARLTTVHHGLDLSLYRFVPRKQPYLAFLGRIAPSKAPHLAIEVARRTGIPLKIAGEIQPTFRDYWETKVKPHVDGKLVEFVGEADLAAKNELLGNAMAMVFPIQWNEPFGLVMIEAMACGTPVLGLRAGSVPEVVEDGVSGWVCDDVAEMARRAQSLSIDPAACREHVARHFTIEQMTRGYEQVYQAAAALAPPPRTRARVVAELDLARAPLPRADAAAAPIPARVDSSPAPRTAGTAQRTPPLMPGSGS